MLSLFLCFERVGFLDTQITCSGIMETAMYMYSYYLVRVRAAYANLLWSNVIFSANYALYLYAGFDLGIDSLRSYLTLIL